MILTGLLLGATAITLGTMVGFFWNEIREWLKKALLKIQEMVGEIVYGCRVFIKKIKDKVSQKSINYVKENRRWHEYTMTREISENDVPQEILKKMQQQESIELTNKIEEQLVMEMS